MDYQDPPPSDACDVDPAPEPLPRYALRLFVAGTTAKSLRAIANLERICTQHLPGRVDLEVIDIYQQPAVAAADEFLVAAPMLVKTQPPPSRRMIGDLSDEALVLSSLGLVPPQAPPVGQVS